MLDDWVAAAGVALDAITFHDIRGSGNAANCATTSNSALRSGFCSVMTRSSWTDCVETQGDLTRQPCAMKRLTVEVLVGMSFVEILVRHVVSHVPSFADFALRA